MVCRRFDVNMKARLNIFFFNKHPRFLARLTHKDLFILYTRYVCRTWNSVTWTTREMIPSSQSPADVLKATVYLWNCITSANRRRIKRETNNKVKRWKEKERWSGFSLRLSVSFPPRRSAVESALGKRAGANACINATINYLSRMHEWFRNVTAPFPDTRLERLRARPLTIAIPYWGALLIDPPGDSKVLVPGHNIGILLTIRDL